MCRIYLPRKGLAVFADGERLSYIHKKGSGVAMASLKYEIATHVYNAVKYKKEGGSYNEVTGIVKKIDAYEKTGLIVKSSWTLE